MPEPTTNDVVMSLAGHDRGKLFVVTGQTPDGRLLLCDGRTRKLSAPKSKSPKHTRVVLRGTPNVPGTDKAIRTTLALAAHSAAAKEERHLGER